MYVLQWGIKHGVYITFVPQMTMELFCLTRIDARGKQEPRGVKMHSIGIEREPMNIQSMSRTPLPSSAPPSSSPTLPFEVYLQDVIDEAIPERSPKVFLQRRTPSLSRFTDLSRAVAGKGVVLQIRG